jgi:penicillin-binding protein 1A
MTEPFPPNQRPDLPDEGPVINNFRRYLPKQWWQLALVGLFGLLTIGILVVTVIALFVLPTLPSIDELAEKRLKVPLRVYTVDEQLLAEFGEEKRIPTKIDDVPEPLIHAILAAEDHGFLYHRGVDFLGILRAAIANVRSGSHSQGGSTITMQVARNYFLSPEKTYTRKVREVLLAFKLERELSKKEILELYVNKIFLGHRAYGFAAASQIYYGKNLVDLTVAEHAMLAGLPKAPSRDNPLTNPENATERRNYVLRQMRKLDYIDDAVLDQALKAPLTASKHALRYDVEASYVAEMVRQELFKLYDEKTYGGGFHVYTTINGKHQAAANHALRKGLMEYERRHGYRGPAAHVSIHGTPDRDRLDDVLKDYHVVGGLVAGVVTKVEDKSVTVYTQDEPNLVVNWPGLAWARTYIDENTVGVAPKTASDILKVGDVVYLERRQVEASAEQPAMEGWWLAQIPHVAGAVVSLRPYDGAIVALAGGFDFYHSSFNRIMQAERQPGSSMKPFIWAAALEKGFTAATTVSGAPIVIEDAQLEDEWRPEDYSKKFFGPTRLRKAMALSLNLVSIRLLRAIGANYTVGYIEEHFGFDGTKLPKNLSLALGTASATPIQMTNAFAVFANGGFQVEPYFITRIEDADHNVLFRASPTLACDNCAPTAPVKPQKPEDAVKNKTDKAEAAPATPRAAVRKLSPEIAFLMTSMMNDVIREGTGRAAAVLNRKDLAGKTGTTNEYRDAWFVGYNSDLVATAWVGFDQPSPLGRAETGGRAALPIWIDYMREVLPSLPEKPLTPPENIVKATVNSETGKPAEPTDPEAIEEYFVKGTETGGETPAVTADTPGGTPPVAPTQTENVREKLF